MARRSTYEPADASQLKIQRGRCLLDTDLLHFWQQASTIHWVGRGAGTLGALGAKKRRPLLGRWALQNLGGAEI